MKKILMMAILFLAVLLGVKCYAQSTEKAILQHGETLSIFHGNTAFQNAILAAVDGDIISLSPGTFDGCPIRKAVKIRGAGYVNDSKNKKYKTEIRGDVMIVLMNNKKGFSLEGIYNNGNIIDSIGLSDYTFKRCRFRGLNFNGSTKNGLINQCRIASVSINAKSENLNIKNCIINALYGEDASGSIQVENCVIKGYIGQNIAVLFRNNIINSYVPVLCASYNNVFLDWNVNNASIKSGDYTGISTVEMFGKDTAGVAYNDSQNYILTETAATKYLGTDGTQVGVHGGITPITDIPSYPQVNIDAVDTKSSADGKLKISFTAKSVSEVVTYEYWFNDSVSQRTQVNVSPANPLELNDIFLQVNNLNTKMSRTNYQIIKDENGIDQFAITNTMSIRFKDADETWSIVRDTTFATPIDNNTLNLSVFINNPDAANGNTGWTTDGPIGCFIQNNTHWSGTKKPYFCLGNTAVAGWTTCMKQTITGLPAGSYCLKVAGRLSADATMSLTAGDISTDFPSYGAVGGEIWEDSAAGSAEKNINNGTGAGWSWRSINFTTDGNPFIIQLSGTTTKVGQWYDVADFTLTPSSVATLDVSLPGSVNAPNYQDLTLQLTDMTTGSKMSVMTTGRQTYTFSGLTSTDRYRIILIAANDSIIGEIENLKLSTGSNAVTFQSLKELCTVSLKVRTTSQNEVTDAVTIQWYKANNQYLGQGNCLKNMTEGTLLYYKIGLNNTLGTQLTEPPKQLYSVTKGSNTVLCILQPIDTLSISGTVKDENKWPLTGASVAVTQLLNGKYSHSLTTQTDRNGQFSLTVYNDSSTIQISYPEYIDQKITYPNFRDIKDLGSTLLHPITGVTITTSFTYTKSSTQEAATEAAINYTNYQNVAYELYNITKKKAITKFFVQYPSLIIQNETDSNDQIQITASSRVNEFSPLTLTVIVDNSGKAIAHFALKDFGAIRATYTNSTNSANLGVLYNAKGELFKKGRYTNATLTFKSLPDGIYHLLSMADSKYYSSMLNLSEFTTSGLIEGVDYAINDVEVKSGVISTVSVATIPDFDESRYYYTESRNTEFSVNKTFLVAGNYVTLSTKLDFKDKYANQISNVSLIINIPENCSLIENSVIIGTNLVAYTYNSHQLTIPLNNKDSDRIRFCIMPTVGGTYTPSASITFNLNKDAYTQPIGSASFTASNMSIFTPSQTAKKDISVSGTAAAYSTVSIYDGSTLIGQTTALATGTWMTTCELYQAYNLTTHHICAQIKTPKDLIIQTETQTVFYDVSTVEVKTVMMINTAHPATSLNTCEYVTVFDFEHPSESMPPYWYWPSYPDFSFKIDFTNNDTSLVSNVKLYVKTTSNDIVCVPASYDRIKKIWVATQKFDSDNLPVNLSVDYCVNPNALIDSKEQTEYWDEAYTIAATYATNLKNIANAFDSGSDSTIQALANKLGVDLNESSKDFDENAFRAFLAGMTNEEFQQYGDSLFNALDLSMIKYSESNELFSKALNFQKEMEFTIPDGGKIKIQNCDGLDINTLQKSGFEPHATTNGDTIYVKKNSLGFSIVDFRNSTYLTYTQALSTRSGLLTQRFASDQSVSEKIEEFKKKFGDVKKTIDDIYGDIMDACEKPLNELLTESSELDKTLLEIDECLKRSTSPIDIAKYRAYQLFIARQKVTNFVAIGAFRKVMPLMNQIVPLARYATLIESATEDLTRLGNIYISIPDPCEKDQNNANVYKAQAASLIGIIGTYIIAEIILDVTGSGEMVIGAAAAPETAGTSLLAVATGAIQKAIVSIGLNWGFMYAKEKSMSTLEANIKNLKCDGSGGGKNGDNNGNGDGNGGGTSGNSGSSNVPHQMDPSGYVYEAVSNNRLEGVTTTLYCKNIEDDIYGDKHEVVTKWDATQYSQINPLITDENGIYAWDVPDGLWQVKFEKPGYETISSDWLPVPPPQLDINIGMHHLTNPKIMNVRGYEEGINIQFNKYIKPACLTSSNIKITWNGSIVSGILKMLNETEGYASDTASYVSKVRFIPNRPFVAGDTVNVKIGSAIESYAGITMGKDSSLVAVIEKEVKKIDSDSTLTIYLHDDGVLSVKVTPMEAAKGKIITAKIASASILGLNSQESVLDENGQATFTITGNLPGATTVKFSMNEVEDVSASSVVTVSQITQAVAPNASIASGSTIPQNKTVELSCSESDAIIYYTTDGSCPCEENGSRQVYKNPVTITKSTILKAISTVNGLYDSDVATFIYHVNTIDDIPANTAKDALFSIYPTVVKSGSTCIVTINETADALSRYKLDVISLAGQIVKTIRPVTKEINISLKEPGLYFLRLKNANSEEQTDKLIVIQ